MTLADVRDVIESWNMAEHVYYGKMPGKMEKAIGVYNSKHQYAGHAALGGAQYEKYGLKHITISIRAEEDEDILKNFTQEQHRIRNEWKRKRARILEKMTDRTAMEADLAGIKAAFMRMAGMGGE